MEHSGKSLIGIQSRENGRREIRDSSLEEIFCFRCKKWGGGKKTMQGGFFVDFLKWEKLQHVCCIVIWTIQCKGIHLYKRNMKKTAGPMSLNSTQVERQTIKRKLYCPFIVTGRERIQGCRCMEEWILGSCECLLTGSVFSVKQEQGEWNLLEVVQEKGRLNDLGTHIVKCRSR